VVNFVAKIINIKFTWGIENILKLKIYGGWCIAPPALKLNNRWGKR
jgi:hypothetical protein